MLGCNTINETKREEKINELLGPAHFVWPDEQNPTLPVADVRRTMRVLWVEASREAKTEFRNEVYHAIKDARTEILKAIDDVAVTQVMMAPSSQDSIVEKLRELEHTLTTLLAVQRLLFGDGDALEVFTKGK